MFLSVKEAPISKVFLNGIDRPSIRFVNEANEGVVWVPNTLESSVWQVKLVDFKFKERSLVNGFRNQITAVLSTALNRLEIPNDDFENFLIAIRVMYPEFESNLGTLMSEKPCSNFDLGNLTLTLADGIELRIP